MTPDGSRVVFSANTGTAAGDGERRHIFSADVAGAGVKQITAGASSEWDPVTMPDGRAGFAQATAQQPAIVTLLPMRTERCARSTRQKCPRIFRRRSW